MCTLILAWQVFEDAPVTVAANRDEATARESYPPHVWDERPRFVAPRDGEAGGTWMGYNEHDVFVGITNRWKVPDEPGERSRGLLVRDTLGFETAEAAAAFVERELAATGYEPFHLVVADADAAFLFSWDEALRLDRLKPGVHIVVNVGADGEYFVPERRPGVGEQQAADADRVRAALEPCAGETGEGWSERAKAVLGDHEYGRCIHGDGFGTKSASVIRLGAHGGAFEHAEGRPCVTDFESVSVPF